MEATRVTFNSGSLSLEGMLAIPEGPGPFPAVVVCHPHPLYGGNMDNNIVDGLCKALGQLPLISLRFNFRGVGRSEGQFGQGVGEKQDIGAAISFASTIERVDRAAIGLAGYSAGAGFAIPWYWGIPTSKLSPQSRLRCQCSISRFSRAIPRQSC